MTHLYPGAHRSHLGRTAHPGEIAKVEPANRLPCAGINRIKFEGLAGSLAGLSAGEHPALPSPHGLYSPNLRHVARASRPIFRTAKELAAN